MAAQQEQGCALQRRRARSRQRGAALASLIGFGGLVNLVAHHPYGIVTETPAPIRAESHAEAGATRNDAFFVESDKGGYRLGTHYSQHQPVARSRVI